MHASIVRMVVAMSGVAIECGFGTRCRRMLAGPPQRTTCGAYGTAEGRQGGDHILSKGFPGRIENVGIASTAGMSHSP